MRRVFPVVLLSALLVLGGFGEAPGATLPPAPPTVATRIDGFAAAPASGRQLAVAAAAAIDSAPARAPFPFSFLGFKVPDGSLLQVRVSQDGTTWEPWTDAEVAEEDEGPDRDGPEARDRGARGATEAIWVGSAQWLQIRVFAGDPAEVTAHVIDSMGLSRSLAGRVTDAVAAAWRGQPAAAEVDAPEIVSRADWGADESWRRGSVSTARIRLGVVHHTATRNDYTMAEAPGIVRGIYGYHTRSLGWSDIGYNLLVDRFGTMYEGRAGGLDQGVIGAHAGGFNTGSFGISVIGTFGAAGPPTAALEQVAQALAWKFDVHHLDITSAWDYRSYGSTRFAKGRVVRVPTLIGHRDVSTTACPGDAFYSLLPALRHRTLELAGPMLLDHEAEPAEATVVRGSAPAIRFGTRLRPAGEWELEVTDPSGNIVHRGAGTGDLAASAWSPTGITDLGRYTYRFTSPDRRTATGTFRLVPPVIRDALVQAGKARVHQSGGSLSEPVRFTARLWPQAQWTLVLLNADGQPVLTRQGEGETLSVAWDQVPGPGTYRWRMTADEAEPVEGAVQILTDVIDRVPGTDPIPGAVALSRTAFAAAGSARHAVIARNDVFADALTAGPLAGKEGPVLFTQGDHLDGRVAAELDRVLAPDGVVYVLGGTAAVSGGVTDALRARWEVVRLSGSGRAETAAAVARVVVAASGATTALVARAGPDSASPWADALAGGVYGAARGVPVLLTDRDELSKATANVLKALGVRETVVLGGTAVISDAVLSELPGARRVSGPDRAATASAVARQLWGRGAAAGGQRIVVADGYGAQAWALALAASPLGARQSAPLLLSNSAGLPPSTRDYLAALGYGSGAMGRAWLVGDGSAVAEPVAADVAALLQ